jgi:hypothetical protein
MSEPYERPAYVERNSCIALEVTESCKWDDQREPSSMANDPFA